MSDSVRFAHVHVFAPKVGQDGQEPRYSVTILILKTDTVGIEKLPAAIKMAAESSQHNFTTLRIFPFELQDGDAQDVYTDVYGSYFLHATAREKAGIVDQHSHPIRNLKEFYGGCYGRVCLMFDPYRCHGGAGIAGCLNHIQAHKSSGASRPLKVSLRGPEYRIRCFVSTNSVPL